MMRELTCTSTIRVAESIDELTDTDILLLQSAKSAVQSAYAPYSRFHVGCALLLENGKIIVGNNQENIAYPSGLCAERVAIFTAGATYPGVPVLAMAITVHADEFKVDQPILCCGACLQSISEYENRYDRTIRMILQGETGEIYLAEGVKTFMPFQFRVEALKRAER